MLGEFSLSYRLWPVEKHNRVLRDLGISPDYANSQSSKDLEVLFRKPISIEEMRHKLKIQVCSPSLARTRVFLTRCESIFTSAYLLWDKIFQHADRKFSFKDLFREIDHDREVCIPELFPMSDEYSYILGLLSKRQIVEPNNMEMVLMKQAFTPFSIGLPTLGELRDCLALIWYGHKNQMRTNISMNTWETLKEIFPFLNEDIDVTLMNSGLDSPYQLITDLVSFTESRRAQSL
jgi:hypothetical protein